MFFTDRVARSLVLSVIAVSGLVMWYILFQLSETKQNFAVQLMEHSVERIETELDEFFHPIENMMMILKQQNEIQFMHNFNTTSHNQYFIPIINQYSQISSIGIADTRGFEFNILPDSTAGSWLNREVYVDEWGMTEKWNMWSVADTLSPTRYWESNLETDPRERSWFKGALEGGGDQIHWTEPYIYMTGELGLTSSIEWKKSKNDTLRHVLALDITVQDITRFSQTLSFTENNQVFILTGAAKNIIGLPQNYSALSNQELIKSLMSTPEEFGNLQLIELLAGPENEIIGLESDGNKWWGILKPYQINSTQELYIAMLLPESDFSEQIDSTRSAIISGFLLILVLSLLLVRNHNKVRKIGRELNEKNTQISKQKERLFSEVHHRVKNNLAVMMALIEIENMESEDDAVKRVLTQTQKRIRSMSAVHEILYKSDDMNRVDVSEFIPGILDFSTKGLEGPKAEIKHQIDATLINVNQALTYALLVNEFMSSLLKSGINIKSSVTFEVGEIENNLVTKIKVGTDTDFLQRGRDVGKQLIEVLISQLGAEMKIDTESESIQYEISFKLQNIKGTTSNYNYRKSDS
jgi:two-component sensor histidine kinase